MIEMTDKAQEILLQGLLNAFCFFIVCGYISRIVMIICNNVCCECKRIKKAQRGIEKNEFEQKRESDIKKAVNYLQK
jgi:hypothetical protein